MVCAGWLSRLAVVASWLGGHAGWPSWAWLDSLLASDAMARLRVDLLSGRGLTIFALPGATGTGAHLLHGLTLLPLIGLLLGWKSRWMALLSWLVVVGWYQRVPGASTGGDRLLRFALFYLALGRCGAVWSLDARRRAEPWVPALPVRLIQLQWVAMYLLSGLEKASGGRWLDGTALHYALSNLTFARAPELSATLTSSAALVPVLKVATVSVLVWELAFPVLVLFRRGRWLALTVGVLIHIGIGLTMSVGPFTAVTLLGYLAFLDRTPVPSRGGAEPDSCNPPSVSANP